MPPTHDGPGPTAYAPARRFVQIAAASANAFKWEMLYGLCNDGTAWVLHRRLDGDKWKRLPPVPRGNEDLDK